MRESEHLFSGIRLLFLGLALIIFSSCGKVQNDDETVLRVSNWEEYIDLGGWDEDETICLSDGTEIFGENPIIEDFEDWYEETYGKKVRVEYSTFGTNEDLYNQMTLGDVYDLVCPSEYMIMKLMREGKLLQYSDSFRDPETEENYYIRGLSPFIRERFQELSIEGIPLWKYASGYFWGTLGIVYNPSMISEEEASHWNLLLDGKHYRQVTIKDSVRDSYFAAAAIAYYDEITDPEFVESPDYHQALTEVLNRTDQETVEKIQDILTSAKGNVYSFETDAGKADMISGTVGANLQWSGDAVYTMQQAEEDGEIYYYSAPEEGTNLWFDGWVMLKSGIEEDPEKQQAAEAFVNFLSRPDNAIRNMYYVGYTSCISGGDSDLILEYIDYSYGLEEDEADGEERDEKEDQEETEEIAYPLGYFFDPEDPLSDEKYYITTDYVNTKSQLFAQYPPENVVDRAVVMACFTDEENERISRMWTNVRCFDLGSWM